MRKVLLMIAAAAAIFSCSKDGLHEIGNQDLYGGGVPDTRAGYRYMSADFEISNPYLNSTRATFTWGVSSIDFVGGTKTTSLTGFDDYSDEDMFFGSTRLAYNASYGGALVDRHLARLAPDMVENINIVFDELQCNQAVPAYNVYAKIYGNDMELVKTGPVVNIAPVDFGTVLYVYSVDMTGVEQQDDYHVEVFVESADETDLNVTLNADFKLIHNEFDIATYNFDLTAVKFNGTVPVAFTSPGLFDIYEPYDVYEEEMVDGQTKTLPSLSSIDFTFDMFYDIDRYDTVAFDVITEVRKANTLVKRDSSRVEQTIDPWTYSINMSGVSTADGDEYDILFEVRAVIVIEELPMKVAVNSTFKLTNSTSYTGNSTYEAKISSMAFKHGSVSTTIPYTQINNGNNITVAKDATSSTYTLADQTEVDFGAAAPSAIDIVFSKLRDTNTSRTDIKYTIKATVKDESGTTLTTQQINNVSQVTTAPYTFTIDMSTVTQKADVYNIAIEVISTYIPPNKTVNFTYAFYNGAPGGYFTDEDYPLGSRDMGISFASMTFVGPNTSLTDYAWGNANVEFGQSSGVKNLFSRTAGFSSGTVTRVDIVLSNFGDIDYSMSPTFMDATFTIKAANGTIVGSKVIENLGEEDEDILISIPITNTSLATQTTAYTIHVGATVKPIKPTITGTIIVNNQTSNSNLEFSWDIYGGINLYNENSLVSTINTSNDNYFRTGDTYLSASEGGYYPARKGFFSTGSMFNNLSGNEHVTRIEPQGVCIMAPVDGDYNLLARFTSVIFKVYDINGNVIAQEDCSSHIWEGNIDLVTPEHLYVPAGQMIYRIEVIAIAQNPL